MKKFFLLATACFFLISPLVSQPALNGKMIKLFSGNDTVWGFYVSDDYILSRYRPVSRMKTPSAVSADGQFSPRVEGYVSAMPEQDLVLLKASSCQGGFFSISAGNCLENSDAYLPDITSAALLRGKCESIRDYGVIVLLTLAALPPEAPDGLPVLNSEGEVLAVTVPRPDENIPSLFAVPASRIRELVAQAGTVKSLELLTPVFENIKEGEYKTQNEKNKALEEYLNQGNLKLYYKDYRAAAEKFTMAIRINPADPDAYVFRGQARYYLMQYKDAMDDFSKAIDLEPGYAEAWDLRGICKAELGDKKGACEDWQRAYELGFTHAFKLLKEFCDIDKMK